MSELDKLTTIVPPSSLMERQQVVQYDFNKLCDDVVREAGLSFEERVAFNEGIQLNKLVKSPLHEILIDTLIKIIDDHKVKGDGDVATQARNQLRILRNLCLALLQSISTLDVNDRQAKSLLLGKLLQSLKV